MGKRYRFEKSYISNPLITKLFFSKLAYFPEKFIEKTLNKFNLKRFDYFGGKVTTAYVAEFDNVVLISYRGVMDYSWYDWNIILDCVPTIYEDTLAHRGFIRAFNEVGDSVLDVSENYDFKNKIVIYTGHSLGGAMSTLTSLHKRPHVITTYGSPMVFSGDSHIEKYSDIDYNRVVTKYDFIHMLPIGWPWNYCHLADPITLTCPFDIRSLMKPHRVETYLECLFGGKFW